METLTNYKDCSKSCIRKKNYVLAFLCTLTLSLVGSLQFNVMVEFRNSFQDHRRLSEQLLESQEATGGLQEGFLNLVR
jgi:hypothetical protein